MNHPEQCGRSDNRPEVMVEAEVPGYGAFQGSSKENTWFTSEHDLQMVGSVNGCALAGNRR